MTLEEATLICLEIMELNSLSPELLLEQAKIDTNLSLRVPSQEHSDNDI